VQSSVRLPRDLAATLSGTFTVRFAVSRDGSVGLIQVMDQVPDPRISEAIVSAVQSCEFRPGTDAAGRPTRLWVVMPLRFVGG
jgi:TonB family protein